MEKHSSEKESKKRLTIESRLNILHSLESGETGSSLARKYGVSEAAISKIKKNKGNILACEKTLSENHGSLKRRRVPTAEQLQLDRALYSWFQQKKNRGEPVSGPILRGKALELNEKLEGSLSFMATDGYLTRFKNRHGLHFLAVQGERLSAVKNTSAKFCSTFYKQMQAEGYTTDQIYNADEAGLWWKTLPRKMFASYDESRADGYKIANDRITLMVCANASGTHKLPLFVIGKSEKPRCFKQSQTLPVKYASQKNAWMDRQKFTEWYTQIFLPEIEKEHRKNGNKCILLLDNAHTHQSAEVLNGMSDLCKVVYMPPNVTSLIQPMNQGVIEKLKKVYRKYFLREFLLNDGSEKTLSEFLKGWNILKCCLYAAESWKALTPENLRNAWKNIIPVHFSTNNVSTNEDDLDVFTFTRLIQRSSHFNDVTQAETLEWLQEDTSDHGWPLLSDEQILYPENETSDDNAVVAENEEEINEPIPTAEEAVRALNKFQAWFQTRWEFDSEDWINMLSYREVAVDVAFNDKFPN